MVVGMKLVMKSVGSGHSGVYKLKTYRTMITELCTGKAKRILKLKIKELAIPVVARCNWRASEVRETLSGVYKFELMRYVYILNIPPFRVE